MSPRRLSPQLRLAVIAVGAMLFACAFAFPSLASRELWTRGFWYLANGNWARLGDINGDGFDDILFAVTSANPSNPQPLGTHLFLGAPYEEPMQELSFPNFYVDGVSAAGDLDDDGYDDFLAVKPGANGQIFVFRGGPLPDFSPDVIGPWSGFRPAFRGVGDLNADGYDDFAIGSGADSSGNPVRGTVAIYFGSASLDVSPDLILAGGAEGDAFGSAIAGGRDLNGDGYQDLAVGAPNADAPGLVDAGEVRIFFGGPGFDSQPDRILQATAAGLFQGSSLDLLADFDGDGFGDLVVALSNGVSVFRGGPGLDAIADWGFVDFNTRGPVSAGDDVNRDHFSDVLVTEAWNTTRGSRVYFGGPTADTFPDSPLPYELSWPPGGTSGPAGDIDGDGFQDWFVMMFVGFATRPTYGVSVLTARTNYHFKTIGTELNPFWTPGPFESGSSLLIQWDGADPARLQYSSGGNVWQTVASGVGGAQHNSISIILPPHPTPAARLRLVAVANDSSYVTSVPFAVTVGVEAKCLHARSMEGGVGINWQANWVAGSQKQYRLYRRDGGSEVRIGPDPLLEDGWIDPAGSPASSYRLTALRSGGLEVPLDSVGVGASLCDTIRYIGPAKFTDSDILVTAGTRQFYCGPIERPSADILLSLDGGNSWPVVQPDVPAGGEYTVDPIHRSLIARLRARLDDVGGTVWRDGPVFMLNANLVLQEFQAVHLGNGVNRVEWRVGSDYGPIQPGELGWVGYRLCRLQSGTCTPLFAMPTADTTYIDSTGTGVATYRLTAVLANASTLFLGVTTTSGVPLPTGRLAVAPSPARRSATIAMTIPSVSGAAGPASDVAVEILDVSGRVVDRLAQTFGPGPGAFQWIPARRGARAGVYFLRVRSEAAGYDRMLKFVVLD